MTEAPPRPFRKVFCVGLDGATFDVIDPLIRQGRLPTLARLLESGAHGYLASTVPPLSAPAWVTFMTGENPGRHGIYHFRAMDQGSLGSGLMGSWAYRGRTIFDHASRAGLKVTAFRVPMTYPPWPINGVMVAGFPTPDTRTTYSSPPEVADQVGSLMKLSPMKSMVATPEVQAEDYDYYLKRSTETLVELAQDAEVDLFCYVNSLTDWIAHKFWRFDDPNAPGYDPEAPQNGLLQEFYEKTDASLGALLEEAPSDALVMVMSDHGTGPRTERRFNTNAWLTSLGLLAPSEVRGRLLLSTLVRRAKEAVPNKTSMKQWLWKKAPPLRGVLKKSAGGLSSYGRGMDCSRSRAYRMSFHDHVEGVNINLMGREPEGIVAPEDYERERDALVQAARATVDPSTGEAVFQEVFKREELYEGEHADRAPDVILVLKPVCEFGLGSGKQIFSTVSSSRLMRSSATHRPEGILSIAGPKVVPGRVDGARLIDIPATILWALGLPIPPDVDGCVLTDAFDPELVAQWPIRLGERDLSNEQSSQDAYSSEEEKQLAAHLEDLGYI